MITNLISRRGRLSAAAGAFLVLVCTVGASAPGARSGSDLFEFAVIGDGDHATLSVGDLAHTGDLGRLQDEARSTGKPLFWFSQAGREYVVRDPQVVERARTIVQPMAELGRKQGKIGAKQGKIGARQGQIGALQGRAGMLEARLALSGLSADAEGRKERDAMRAELRELSEQITDLAREQRSLGDNQQELGAQQAELGRQQKNATRDAIAGLRELAEDAIASGAAERIHG